MQRYYFDHNATTPVAPEVFEAMTPLLTNVYGNSSSIHRFGQDARALVEQARRQLAELLGCESKDIVFTSGGTEADNLAIRGLVRADTGAKKHVIANVAEHPAVLDSCHALEREGVEITWLRVDGQGLVSPDDVRAALRPETVLVSVMAANNELGVIQPIEEIATITREAGVLFHTDAVQATGKIPTKVGELGVDLLSLSAHKIHGPKGVGALYVRKGVDLEPTQFGGHQERDRRPGTLNSPGIVGLGAAAELAAQSLESEGSRLATLRDRLERGLIESVSDSWINGARAPRTPNTTNIGFDYVEGEAMLIALDLKGFAVSSGAACSSGAVEPSHVLTSIGLSRKQARSCLRFSLGKQNTDQDIDALLEAMPQIIERLRRLAPARA